MENPQIVSREHWVAARLRLLALEKEFTRRRDDLSAERRRLPMVRVNKRYVFDGPTGPTTLPELFDGRRQLVVYHFMFAPDWEEGCKSCSHFIDTIAGAVVHLAARDTAFTAVSRGGMDRIAAFRQRMGWTFPWVSSQVTDFNQDFHVTLDESAGSVEYNYASVAALKQEGKIWMDELPGLSVFLRQDDAVFHTYSTYARGLDPLMNTYNMLDLTPLGRQEEGLPWAQSWVRHHGRYAA